MNDYKELIENVRICTSGDCWGCTLHSNKINCQEELLESAADAIEQLVKERDAAVDIANNTHYSAMIKLQKNDETIAGLFRDRDILRRERDAAVADIKDAASFPCRFCKKEYLVFLPQRVL